MSRAEAWGRALIETLKEIDVPPGAPGKLSLYLLPRPEKFDGLYYLCNAGRAPLFDVMVIVDWMCRFNGLARNRTRLRPPKLKERWRKEAQSYARHWDILPPGRGILVGFDDYYFGIELIERYRISYTTARGHRHVTRVTDPWARDEPRWKKLRPRCAFGLSRAAPLPFLELDT